MKSLVEEASSVVKAIEKAWTRAGKPQSFSVKIFEESQSGFLGFNSKPAKIGIFYEEVNEQPQRQNRDTRNFRDKDQQRPHSKNQPPRNNRNEGRRNHRNDRADNEPRNTESQKNSDDRRQNNRRPQKSHHQRRPAQDREQIQHEPTKEIAKEVAKPVEKTPETRRVLRYSNRRYHGPAKDKKDN